jgi:PiT family inorganic phosphate transporter
MALLVGLIAIALAFDFLNGRNDAANSIATIVSTRVLSPRLAVAWAAFFNFVAFLVFGLNVAATVGQGIISPNAISDEVVFGALMGAICWQVITGYFGIPSSSSHALIGGLVGSGVARLGLGAIVWNGLGKTAGAIILSPMTGLAIALLLVLIVSWSFRKAIPTHADSLFRKAQFVSASLYSLGHGGNDAQKTMGIITALLFAHGQLSGEFHVPLWVVVACNGAIAFGTFLGGWRIVRTMGSRITRLTPMQGVCAETAGSITLFMATGLGIPVSTTHTITGAIVGVGAARRATAVRWSVAQEIVIAWIVTMPAAAVLGAAFYRLASAMP